MFIRSRGFAPCSVVLRVMVGCALLADLTARLWAADPRATMQDVRTRLLALGRAPLNAPSYVRHGVVFDPLAKLSP